VIAIPEDEEARGLEVPTVGRLRGGVEHPIQVLVADRIRAKAADRTLRENRLADRRIELGRRGQTLLVGHDSTRAVESPPEQVALAGRGSRGLGVHGSA
jgi:hypothetical protein